MQKVVACQIGTDYPSPIVDHAVAARLARERVWAVRRGDAFRSEARVILIRHGSRKRTTAPSRERLPRDAEPPATHAQPTSTISPQMTFDLTLRDM